MTYFQSNGIQIALDDYGTGASSLSLALELPVAEIKIDRTFTKDVMHDPLKQAIVQSILDFARKTHVRSCIEGIENTEIAEVQSFKVALLARERACRYIPSTRTSSASSRHC